MKEEAWTPPIPEKGGTASNTTFCFDYPSLNEDARLFSEETISFDGERAS